MHAVCSDCKKLADLKVCFDCKYTLCDECIRKHFNDWRVDAIVKCLTTEKTLDKYNSQIDQFRSKSANSQKLLESAEADIQEKYTQLVQLLIKEKEELLNQINKLKQETKSFDEFLDNNKKICTNLSQFREAPDSNASNFINQMVDKFNNNYELSKKSETTFKDLESKTITLISKFETVPLPETADLKQIGRFHTTETSLIKEYIEPPIDHVRVLMSAPLHRSPPGPPNQIFPNLAANALIKSFMGGQKCESYEKWRCKANQRNFDEECNINADFTPAHLTTFRNYLFSLNETDKIECLCIFDIATTGKIELKNTFRMSVPNVRGIAANKDYFALTYSNLKSSDMRNKNRNLKPSGVFIYNRDRHMLLKKCDIAIEVPDTGFKNPRGIALDMTFMYVCDQELGAVFKFDIESGQMVNSINIPNGYPSKCSINMNYLVLTDTINHEISVYDIQNFTKQSSKSVESSSYADAGPFDVILTDDNLIIYKLHSDFKLVATDVDLKEEFSFENIRTSILGYCMLEVPGRQALVIGTNCSHKDKHTFIVYNA